MSPFTDSKVFRSWNLLFNRKSKSMILREMKLNLEYMLGIMKALESSLFKKRCPYHVKDKRTWLRNYFR